MSDPASPPAVLGHEVACLINASVHALENETSGTPLSARGVVGTLLVALAKVDELITLVEALPPHSPPAKPPEVH